MLHVWPSLQSLSPLHKEVLHKADKGLSAEMQ
jgi:hypothetical protein